MKKVQKPNVYLACNACWVIVFTWLTFGFQVSRVEAQGVKINNATLKPSGNIKIVVKDGDLINNGIYATASETFTFTGTQAVVVSGTASTTFANLTLSNEAGLTLQNDVSISGMLEFVNGKIATGDHLMTMGPVGTFSNTSSVRYVEGKLANTFSTPATKPFPIGKGGNFRPVTLEFSSLTGTSTVIAEQFETGLTGTLPSDVALTTTNRSWTITQSGGSDMQYFVTLDATDYTPETPVVILKKDAGLITSHEATFPDYTNTTALTSFSDFGLGEECVNPTDGGTITGEQTICADDSPTELTGDVPPGSTGTLEYKWQVSVTSSTEGFSFIFGNTNSQNYTPASVTQTSWFKRLSRVACKSDWTGAAESNVVQITVNPASVGGSIAGTTSVCYEINSTLLTLSGHEGSILRWEYTLTDWTTPQTITNTTTTYTATDLTATTKYRAVVKNGDCDEVYSGEATITVYDDFDPGEILTTGETIWKGDDAEEIGSSEAASGGDGTYTYLWQSSLTEAFTSPLDITGSNSASYNSGTLDVTTWFRRTVKDGTCNTTPETSAGVWKVTVNDPVFEDDMANKSMTWNDALSLAQSFGAGTITLLKDYTQTADAIINHDIYLDLNGHTFGGGKVNTIASAKRFGFFNSLTTGTFDNEIQFADATSTLTLFENFTPGALFTSANSANDGVLQLGNYFNPFEFSLTTTNEALFTKVHTFNPRNNVTLKMNGGLTTTATIQADDGAVVKLGAGTFTQDFWSTMPTGSTANIQVGDSVAAEVTITGDFSSYGGTITFFDGSTLNMDLEEMSMNPFTTTIGGSTSATTLIKKGGDYSIGNPSANHGIRLEPYGVLDLTNASNSDDLNVYGNILIFGYDNPNTPKIKFLITKSGDEIYTNELMTLGGKILTNDPNENQIDVSRHFVFDMNNVTGTIGQTYQIRFATTTGACSTTGTPAPLNAKGWENFSVSTVPSSETGFFHLILNATYTGCFNPISGGTLTENQAGCVSFDPAEITGTLPTGHSGTPVYKWQKSETSAVADFEDIASSNSQNYNPGTVTMTTWFKRLSRADCKADWTGAAESNVVEMTVNQPSRRYVTVNGAGLKDGSDWDNAYDHTMLQDAISEDCVNEVWVTGGTYKPEQESDGTTDEPRKFTFQMKDGVGLYGGFAGTETSLSQRDYFTNETILSGDLSGNDEFEIGVFNVYKNNSGTDNCYSVLLNLGNSLSSAAILDGFTISGGNANTGFPGNVGAGMQTDGTPVLRNLIFTHNYSSGGGALFLVNAGGGDLSNLSFIENSGGEGSGGLYLYELSSPAVLTNALFLNNRGVHGGGINNNNSTLTVNNATFSRNEVWGNGGAIENRDNGTLTLNNCIIWNNIAYDNGNEIYHSGNTTTLNNCCYKNESGDVYGTLTTSDCITLDPLFADPPADDFRLTSDSPCLDTGSDGYNDELYDIRGKGFGRKLLKTDHTQTGTIDMGAYEYYEGTDPESCINPTAGGTISASQTICYGTSPDAFSSVTLPSGHSGTLEYQWQLNTVSATASFDHWEFVGAVSTTSSYDHVGTLTQTTWFRRLARVTCDPVGWASATASDVVEITVRSQFSSGEIKTDGQTICYEADPVEIGSHTVASGGDGLITYKWEFSTDDFATDGTEIIGAASSTYDPPSGLTETTSYRRYAKDGTCNTDFETSTGTWKVSVQEELTLNCPKDIEQTNDSGKCTASVTFAATPGGTPTPTLTYMLNGSPITSGHVFEVGTHTVVVTAENNCGVVTCSFTVTVKDTEKPDVICQNITINLDETGNATITPAAIDDGSFDNCGIETNTMTLSRTNFGCDDMGSIPVTLSATDVNGNTASCTATVTVNELSVPLVRVNITASKAPNGQVLFKAIPVNGGANPTYKWFKNGIEIIGETSNALISTCTSGDEHWVELTSSIPCTAIATSNAMCTY